MVNPNNPLRNYATLVAQADVPNVTVHGLRHTHATLLLLDGVPLIVVSKRLGHAKTSTTLDVYGHLLPGHAARAVESISNALLA